MPAPPTSPSSSSRDRAPSPRAWPWDSSSPRPPSPPTWPPAKRPLPHTPTGPLPRSSKTLRRSGSSASTSSSPPSSTMVSLARLWREAGVQPAGLVGHSQGEIAAAHIAGALSLEDAALIIAERGKAMAKIAGRGGMLSVSLTPERLKPLTEPYAERVSLAAINGPASLVLSGEPDALKEIQSTCEAQGTRAQAIAVDYAAHSSQIEDLEEELLEAFASISPQDAEIPLHSTVTGEPVEGVDLG